MSVTRTKHRQQQSILSHSLPSTHPKLQCYKSNAIAQQSYEAQIHHPSRPLDCHSGCSRFKSVASCALMLPDVSTQCPRGCCFWPRKEKPRTDTGVLLTVTMDVPDSRRSHLTLWFIAECSEALAADSILRSRFIAECSEVTTLGLHLPIAP